MPDNLHNLLISSPKCQQVVMPWESLEIKRLCDFWFLGIFYSIKFKSEKREAAKGIAVYSYYNVSKNRN